MLLLQQLHLTTARTIHGVSFDGSANIDLSEVIQDTVGAMFGSNTETGIQLSTKIQMVLLI